MSKCIKRKPLRYTYTRYRPTARVLSTVLIASIRVVVVGIENRAQNDASGPGHARVPLTRYLHVLGKIISSFRFVLLYGFV